MTKQISAEIISIGTEILLGVLTDTNSVYMAQALRELGVNVFFMSSVGDNEARIASVIEVALSRADVVIMCGGLGPTVDDMTREAVARALDRKLVFHAELLEQIAERFGRYRTQMTENNKRQAYLPEHAIVIENPVGTAPSFSVELEDQTIICLPGVPREMKFLFQEKVIPYLRTRYTLTDVIHIRTLKTAGIGESMLDEILGSELLNGANPSIGLAAHMGQIDIRITAKAGTLERAQELIMPVESAVRQRVGKYIFGADDDVMERVLLNLLQQHQLSLDIVECGIEQSIQQRLVAIEPTASQWRAHHYATLEDLRHSLSASPQHTKLDLGRQLVEEIMSSSLSSVVIAIISEVGVDESDTNAGTLIVVATAKGKRERSFGFGSQYDQFAQLVGNWGFAIAWSLLVDLLEEAP
ncbi:MAG: competence/damage-inducible protein A [Phototrophicaceae bacterium]